jgi:hypothetical protein
LPAILELEIDVDLIKYAMEQETEKAMWDVWKSMYGFMAAKFIKPVSFSDFKDQIGKPKGKFTNLTAEQIEAEIMPFIKKKRG